MRVSELMHTPPVTCTPHLPLRDVARLMGIHDVGAVLVVDEVGETCGIVTDRDIALRGVGQGQSADVTVDRIMTRDVATVSPAAPIETAASTMEKRRVRRLAVVDDEGGLHGMVTVDDLLRHLDDETHLLADTLRHQGMAHRG